MKKIQIISTALIGLTLAACNGGGGSNSSSSNASSTSNTPIESSGLPQKSSNSTVSNVVPVTVDGGPSGNSPYNTPFVSVTVCSVSNPTNCQTIDHIILDTGSMGLRIFANKLNSNLNLTNENVNGSPTAECTLFGSGLEYALTPGHLIRV